MGSVAGEASVRIVGQTQTQKKKDRWQGSRGDRAQVRRGIPAVAMGGVASRHCTSSLVAESYYSTTARHDTRQHCRRRTRKVGKAGIGDVMEMRQS